MYDFHDYFLTPQQDMVVMELHKKALHVIKRLVQKLTQDLN